MIGAVVILAIAALATCESGWAPLIFCVAILALCLIGGL